MITRTILLTSLGPALLLAGCMGTQNRGLESVHQPIVSGSEYAVDVNVSGGRLAAGEAQRLAGWMGSMRLGYGDRIAIDDPAGDSFGARADVAREVGRYGLLLSDDVPVSAAPVTPGTVRVIVSRMYASVPGCPDGSRDESNEFDSNTSSNHGCAVNSSLAAMVARPEDLVRGQGGTETNDPASSAKAIDAYRKAAPTGGGGSTVKAESTK